VLAFGDGYNDMDMLAWAGRGVAMGDAPPQLIEVANAVTGTFAEIGVMTELEKWF
jgi:hydroxymethylpyrimidine pyrophosphatase-like HAD family hydrolase